MDAELQSKFDALNLKMAEMEVWRETVKNTGMIAPQRGEVFGFDSMQKIIHPWKVFPFSSTEVKVIAGTAYALKGEGGEAINASVGGFNAGDILTVDISSYNDIYIAATVTSSYLGVNIDFFGPFASDDTAIADYDMSWKIATMDTGLVSAQYLRSDMMIHFPKKNEISDFCADESPVGWIDYTDGQGVFLAGYKNGDGDFGTIGGTGGSKTHQHAGVEGHVHELLPYVGSGDGAAMGTDWSLPTANDGGHQHDAQTNLDPFIVVKRMYWPGLGTLTWRQTPT